ncbi:putative DNA binding domain-containing protein [Bacteroides sp. BFG-638]|uniref:DNA binding domain-containing protein n=1 Tax=Bacteroides vicugnae TaxID=3037989 RepID=A0ABU5HPB7_9BACE|nr:MULTISPECIES: RNA-binding domain-containing protein [unclassified Bacteroides]MCS2949457.1 putative DNA binding domain-containing protein [Bacteroides sp. BFG-638]MDY7253673.1 putative DNA binding domain-containing protein [Bacteroides sp. A1-P5]MDY7257946.1 putative DNA binding domain-containing protein [Bacteroides sp. A2-P53]
MTIKDILKLRDLGEVSKVQFKERILDKYDIGCELVGMSNARGGQLVIGINDKTGAFNPLSYAEVQETTNLLSNMASENVVPNILLEIDTVSVEGGSVVIATIKEGINKPYHDNKGIVWMKNGADKRKVFDNAELAEMMTECGSFTPDEAAVRDATLDDLDEDTIKQFLQNRFAMVLEKKGMIGDALQEASLDEIANAIAKGHDLNKLMRNLRFIRPDGSLTVAAILLFGKYTQRWLPVMTAKCISYVGNSIGGKVFRDKVNDAIMEGNLLHQFETIMSFFTRNLKNVQVEKEFNSLGELEIPYVSLMEFVVNALVHRSLNWKVPIRIFIFDNRVEIHSPGTLPNGLQVEDITNGTSMPRNNFLFSNAIYLLPYTGAGSGIQRALEEGVQVEFTNDERIHEFLTTIKRNKDLDSNLADSDTTPNTFSEQSDITPNTFDECPNTFSEHLDITPNTSDECPNTFSEHLDITPNTSDECPNTHQMKLTNKQKDIVNFCSVPRSSREILERVGVKYHNSNIKRYVTELVDAGYLERTIPDNPFDMNQKYKKKQSL